MKKILFFTLSIAVIFFIVGFLTLPHYGINWDEPEHYIRGQAYLHFFLTGKKDYADLPKLRIHYPNNSTPTTDHIDFEDDRSFRRSIYQFDREGSRLMFSYYRSSDSGHPPLNGILASLSNVIFYQKLGVLGDIESYHLLPVVVSAILIAAIFAFTAETFGIFAGIVAVVSLTLYPLFFAESHFNIKDPVESGFYALTILFGYFSVTKNSPRLALLVGLFGGLALGTKLNVLFAFGTLFIWCIIMFRKKLFRHQWPLSLWTTLVLLSSPLIALAVVMLFWPYLWSSPINHGLEILKYYKEIGYTVSYQPSSFLLFGIINIYAWEWVLFATPLVTLGLTFFGLWYALIHWRKEQYAPSLLVVFWLLMPLIRVSMPNAGIYGGLRQIMEYIPAMAILAGIGGREFVQLLENKIARGRKTFIFRLVVLSFFLPIALKLISIHPNQNVYVNPLIGGLQGARQRNFPDWGVTLGSVYQQGVDWLNLNAEFGANLTLIKGLLSNVPSIKLRKDIHFGEEYYSGTAKKGEYIMEVFDYYWTRDVSQEKRQYLATLVPIHQVTVEGVPILMIWKNDTTHTRTTQ